jgi:hypothetical protein
VVGNDSDGKLSCQLCGATEHTASESVACLRAMFPVCFFACFDEIAWPARSPDFSVPDYLF